MKKKNCLGLTLCLAMLFAIFSGCAGDTDGEPGGPLPGDAETSAADGEEQLEVTWVYTKGGFDAAPEENVILEEIESKSGVKLNLISPPFSSYEEKVSIIMASNDLPDLILLHTLASMHDYAEQGALMPLNDILADAPHVQEVVPKEALDICSIDGQIYAVPIWTSQHRYNFLIRQDWLDNVGMEAPTTLDELYDVLVAFRDNDPDQNGVDDTYGISGTGLEGLEAIFGAFGVMGPHRGYWYDDGGVLKPQATNPRAKEALELLQGWYAEGLIDPEIMILTTEPELNEKAYKNQFGVTHRWWTWEPKVEAEMQKVDPNVQFARIAPPVGPEGFSGVRGTPWVNKPHVVLHNSPNTKAIAKLLDYLHTEEGMLTQYSGVEGIHWERRDDGKYYTLPQFDVDAKWVQWYSLFEPEPVLLYIETPLVQSRRDSFEWNVIADDKDGYVTEAEVKYIVDLQALVEDAYGKIITGKESIDYFDTFVEEYNRRGGDEWGRELNALYQQ